MAQPTDPELLARVAGGDERALRELVEHHSAWLLLRLRRRTYDEDLATSALQDTFVAVWRNARGRRGDGDRDRLGDLAAGRGEACPGQRWAIGAVPAVTAWALVRPLARQLPVFPYTLAGEYGDWASSTAGWTAAGLLAGVLLSLVLTSEGRLWERIAS